MKRNGLQRIVFLSITVLLASLLFSVGARAEDISWQPATGYSYIDPADNVVKTGTFTAGEMGTMKFYLSAGKSGQARSQFATTTGGAATWTGNLKQILGAKMGETWDFTVRQGFVNLDGTEAISAESAVYSYLFPFPPKRTPAAPGKPSIK